MKVKMLVGLSGPEYSLAPGDEWEFGAEEAGRLIAAEIAEGLEPVTTLERRGRQRKQENVVSADGDGPAGG